MQQCNNTTNSLWNMETCWLYCCQIAQLSSSGNSRTFPDTVLVSRVALYLLVNVWACPDFRRLCPLPCQKCLLKVVFELNRYSACWRNLQFVWPSHDCDYFLSDPRATLYRQNVEERESTQEFSACEADRRPKFGKVGSASWTGWLAWSLAVTAVQKKSVGGLACACFPIDLFRMNIV